MQPSSSPHHHRRQIIGVTITLPALLALLLAALAAPPQAARAASLTVTSLADTVADDGQCTLREAITAANSDTASGAAVGECAAGSGADTITFSGGGTITLGGTELLISSDVTITGPATAPGVIVSANNLSRVLHISGGDVTINNLTIRDGRLAGTGVGIYLEGGSLALNSSTVAANVIPSGSFAGAGLSIAATTTATLSNVTVSGNTTTYDGAGILNSGTLTLLSSTITANSAAGGGGGVESGGTLTLANTIIAGNSATWGGTLDCYFSSGTRSSSGYNLFGSAGTCGLTGGFQATDLTNVSARLGPLADYGGPTMTHLPLHGSPVIDAGNTALSADQRGVARPVGASYDIGAVEYIPTPMPALSPVANAQGVAPGTNITATYAATLDPATVTAGTLVVHGGASGRLAGSYGASGLVASADPTRSLLPGEQVDITARSVIHGAAGAPIVDRPTVWQFRAAAQGGSGHMRAHPTTPSFGAGTSLDLALGDLDGDGDLDAVVANYSNQAETVWVNNGSGAFSAHPTTPSFGTGDSQGVALGDLDGDGDLDAVVANFNQLATAWLNNGSGVFTAHPTTPSFGGGSSTGVSLGDLDGDGDLDAVVANYWGGAETVWVNNGSGAFSAHPSTPSFGAGNSYEVALGDLDSDGDLDAVVANDSGAAETVWLNDGSGVFSAHPSTPSFGADSSVDLALGDLDGDGDLDAVVANYGAGAETVWVNNGSGVFSAHPSTPSFGASDSYGLALGDLDADDDLDVVVVNDSGEPETAWLNNGSGVFSAHPSAPTFTGGDSRGVALGDLDADGDLDAAIANVGVEAETTWLNDGSVRIVNSLADNESDGCAVNACTLREAIADAPVGGTIYFSVSGTITLGGSELLIDSDVTIAGPATAPGIAVSANNLSRVFHVAVGATVTISNLTIRNGQIAGNVGAGIYNGGTLTLNGVTLTANTNVDNQGGAIYSDAGSQLTILNSTISGNAALYNGGAIYLRSGTLNLTNTTITDNHSTSTVIPGTGGLMLYNEVGPAVANLRNTILAGNTSNLALFRDCGIIGTLNSLDYNLLGTTDGLDVRSCLTSGAHDQANLTAASLMLRPLADYGGPSFTHTPFPGSPAINAIPAPGNGAPATDQRGVARPAGASYDIGAVEYIPTPVPTLSPAANAQAAARGANITATYAANPDPATVTAGALVVHGGASGRLAGSYGATGAAATADPTRSLLPGEQVDVTARSVIHGAAGAVIVDRPTVWQFRAATQGGSGQMQAALRTPSFDAGLDSSEVALGDLDGDGDLDAVVANWNNQPEQIWLNDGGAGFTHYADFGQGNSSAVALGDLDSDGDLDAVIANHSSTGDQSETVWLNDGHANLTPHPTAPSFARDQANESTWDIALGDLDGDGDLDAVVANWGQAQTAWLNDGTGHFTAHPSTPTFGSVNAAAVSLGDLDGDGDLDAIFGTVSGAEGQGQRIWLNDGSGGFTTQRPSFGGDGLGVPLGDLDGDGDLDCVVVDGNARIWRNDGSGNFTAHPSVPAVGAGDGFEGALGDLDGDGDLDLVVANRSLGAETTWLNNGSGAFAAHTIVPSFGGGNSQGLALGDLDGDGDLDTFVANQGQSETVWVNNAIPVITQGSSASVTMDEDGAPDPFALNLTVTDSDGGATLTWSIADAAEHGTATASGSGTSKDIDYTPDTDYFGSDGFVVRVTDSNGFTDEITVNVTIDSVNDAPTLDAIGDPAAIDEDAGAQTVDLAGISAGPANESAQTLAVTASSDNTALIPNPTVTYTSPNATGSLSYTPVANANGSATITVRVTDSGGTTNGGTDYTEYSFTVQVSPVNDAPTLDAIGDPAAIDEDAGAQTVNLAGISAGPANESAQTLTVTASSNNAALIPDPAVTYTSPNATGSLSYTPVANASGSAVITVRVTDSGGTAFEGLNYRERTFTVVVNAVNDPPVNTVPGPQTVIEHTSHSIGGISVADIDAGGAPARVTLEVLHGTLTVTPGATGTTVSGNGSATVVLDGTLTQINATLVAGVSYRSDVGFTTEDTLTVTSDDLGHTGTGAVTTDSDTVTITVEERADLAVAISASPDPVSAGAQVTYIITATNHGPSVATGAALTVAFTGLTFDSASLPCAGTPLTCALGDIDPEESVEVTLVATVSPSARGAVSATARATSTIVDPESGNNERTEGTAVSDAAILALSKTANVSQATPGGSLTYTLVVTNTGLTDALNVLLSDQLLAGLSLDGASASQGTCSGSDEITCELGGLSAGARATVTISVTLPPNLRGVLVNTAQVSSDEPETTYVLHQIDLVPEVDIVLTGSATPDPVDLGSPLSYTLKVTNQGPSMATGVQLTATLPANVTLQSSAASQGACAGAGPVVCDLGTMEAGVQATVTLVVVPGSGRQVQLQATVDAESEEVDPTDNDLTITTGIVLQRLYLPALHLPAPPPDLVVQRIATDGGALRVTVKNQGLGPVTEGFWVELYISPSQAPTRVNQLWNQLGTRGLVWGVTEGALPLAPGASLTLSVGDSYYQANNSSFGGPIEQGAQIYAQADSWNGDTTYGAVLESHERSGGAYNNISTTTAASRISQPATGTVAPSGAPAAGSVLPARPHRSAPTVEE